MVEAADNNQELYEKLDVVLEAEKNNTVVTDEEKEAVLRQLNELANSSNDFDPERLDSIIAFAQSYGNNAAAEAVLRKATEQKTAAEQNEQNDNTPPQPQPQNQTILSAQFRNDIPLISQSSYNVYKAYTELKSKENPTPEELQQITSIEKQVEAILTNVSPEYIDTDNAVELQDYLDIGLASDADEATKNRYAELQKTVSEKLKEYDAQNGLEGIAESGLTPETLKRNQNLWVQAATQINVENTRTTLSPIMSSLPKEQQKEIFDTLQRIAIFSLDDKTPDQNAVQVFQDTLDNSAETFKALVNAEYLKQEAMAAFCEQNNLSPEDLDSLLKNAEKGIFLSDKEKQLKAQFDQYLTEHTAKFPDFNGPYTNKNFLENAVTSTSLIMALQQKTRSNRIARLINAPAISERVNKFNQNLAEKHPTAYKALSTAKTLGKGMIMTAAIGAALGPAGLAGYSIWKTGAAIGKSFNQYKEKEGGNFIGFLQHLTKRENRAELIGLAGQIAASAISGYFAIDGGLAANAGIVGHLYEHAGEQTAQAVQHAGSIFTPRRIASTVSSLGIGTVKALNAMSNKRHARNQIKDILKQNGVDVSKDMLKKLEKCASKEEFAKALIEIAPNISAEQAEQAYNFADLARNSNAGKAFLTTVAGAAIGLAAAEAAEQFSDHTADNHTPESNDHDNNTSDTPKTAAASQTQDNTPDPTTELNAIANSLWENKEGAANRLESFGIDAKNANEMLREMGVIKEGDNHFYRQHELDRLVNNADLTDQQKITIQEWANDREARVHNMQAWQAEHAHHHGSSHNTASPVQDNSQNTGETTVTQDGQEQTQTGNQTQETVTTEETTQEQVEKQKYHVQGRIDKLRGLQGNVEATNPIEAAQAFHQSKGIDLQRSSNLTITDEQGDRTVLKTRIGNRTETTKITSYDGEEKTSYQKTKFYKTGSAEGASRTTIKGDFDGDGKKDIMKTTTDANGNSVTMTKYASGERTLSTTQGGNTTEISVSGMVEKGDSKSHATAVLKDDYNKISRALRGKNRE